MAKPIDFVNNQMTTILTTTIPGGESLSDSIPMTGTSFVHIGIPAGLSASQITYLGSYDNVNFYPIRDGDLNSNYVTACDNSACLTRIDATYFIGISYIKIQVDLSTEVDTTFLICTWPL
jgi:hypothetical protein